MFKFPSDIEKGKFVQSKRAMEDPKYTKRGIFHPPPSQNRLMRDIGCHLLTSTSPATHVAADDVAFSIHVFPHDWHEWAYEGWLSQQCLMRHVEGSRAGRRAVLSYFCLNTCLDICLNGGGDRWLGRRRCHLCWHVDIHHLPPKPVTWGLQKQRRKEPSLLGSSSCILVCYWHLAITLTTRW